MEKIQFYDYQVNSKIKQIKKLKAFLLSVFKEEGVPVNEVGFIFCTDDYLFRLNKKFLKHRYFTDTITFVFSKKNELLSGEGYISVDRVKENSKNLGILYQEELCRVLIHSTLHLCGYSDKPVPAKNIMEQKQEKYLKKWLFHVKQEK